METLKRVKVILSEILDVEEEIINSESYVVKELGAESIDMLELSVNFISSFNINVNDDDIFLRKLRNFIIEADEKNKDEKQYLKNKYPFLKHDRIEDILSDIDNGPVLKVKDFLSYIEWRLNNE